MTHRAKIEQHAERAVPDEAPEILAQGMVAHVGFSLDGQPYVIPFSYHYDPATPRRLYLHGGLDSRALKHLAGGAKLCISVTLLDELVYSRTALHHSMNYRSVVCFGRGKVITSQEEKDAVFKRMVGRYFPGREAGRDYEAPPAAHLEQTALVEVEIEEMSAKARSGGPTGPRDADESALGTSGVVKVKPPNS